VDCLIKRKIMVPSCARERERERARASVRAGGREERGLIRASRGDSLAHARLDSLSISRGVY
jgi:hypothetical protein